jgi:hypothetical protein
MIAPMEWLSKKTENFTWKKECQKSLDLLKKKLVRAPILVLQNWTIESHVPVDASGIVLGAILAQPKEGKLDHLVCFSNKKLSKVERSYTTIEKETLVMVY